MRPRAGRHYVSSASVEILGAKFKFLILGGGGGGAAMLGAADGGSGMAGWRPNTSVSHRNTTGLPHAAHTAPRAPPEVGDHFLGVQGAGRNWVQELYI